jgi:hypothetical protein
MTYAHNHPFSPHYKGAVAEELARPRYPNRAQQPSANSRVKLCKGESIKAREMEKPVGRLKKG